MLYEENKGLKLKDKIDFDLQSQAPRLLHETFRKICTPSQIGTVCSCTSLALQTAVYHTNQDFRKSN